VNIPLDKLGEISRMKIKGSGKLASTQQVLAGALAWPSLPDPAKAKGWMAIPLPFFT